MALRVCTCHRLYSVIWRTECPGVRNSCESPIFTLEDSDWCFESKVDPNDFWETDQWLINLKNLSRFEFLRGFQVTTYIEDRKGRLEHIDCAKLSFTGPSSVCISSHFASQILDRKHELMVDDLFTLVFVFDRPSGASFRKESWKRTKAENPTEVSSCLESLTMDFSKLLDGGMHPDLELKCEGKSLPAHKAILSARSAVFEAMLQSDMLEKRTGSVEIVDMEFHVLREFLRYLYTSTLPEQSVETAMRLYEVSDKYAVEGLKKKCGDFLLDNLKQDNVYEILALADAHSDIQLKDHIIYYIVDRDTLLSCKQWPRFSDSNPKLANEILYRAYKTKCSPK